MRITEGQLRQIIRETIRSEMREGVLDKIAGVFGGGKGSALKDNRDFMQMVEKGTKNLIVSYLKGWKGNAKDPNNQVEGDEAVIDYLRELQSQIMQLKSKASKAKAGTPADPSVVDDLGGILRKSMDIDRKFFEKAVKDAKGVITADDVDAIAGVIKTYAIRQGMSSRDHKVMLGSV